jgi:CCR4-NOT complex subunit CAF16
VSALAVEVRGLHFRYAGDERPVLRDLHLALPSGVRALLVGANGAGKTTLLTLLAGRHLVADETVRVLGRPAFSDTSLVERVSFIGGPFPLDVDVGVDEILDARPHADPARRDRLLAVLGVERRWRMSRVSDGQRRRVQILLGLLDPSDLLLLDEPTTDLDVIARSDLLRFLRDECEARGTTILYATHILDGLEAWATHLALLEGGRIARLDPIDAVGRPLLRVVEGWLRGGANAG